MKGIHVHKFDDVAAYIDTQIPTNLLSELPYVYTDRPPCYYVRAHAYLAIKTMVEYLVNEGYQALELLYWSEFREGCCMAVISSLRKNTRTRKKSRLKVV